MAVCNDTSFSHLSAALGFKTITLMADTPLIYGSYSSRMYPIIPDGETDVEHNTLGKDRINPDKIYEKLVKRRTAEIYEVKKGEYIQIIDPAGRQCSDFLTFDKELNLIFYHG